MSATRSAVAGSFMTSLNLPGFSLTLLLLPREPVALPATSTASSALKFDSSLLVDLFDAPTDAPAWKWTYKGEPEMKVLKEGDESKVGKKQEKAGEEVKGPKRECWGFAAAYQHLWHDCPV